MSISLLLRLGLAALASGAATSLAFAQQDVQITSEAINRVCAERYGTQNVQTEAPTVRGAEDVTLNCRVVNANGPTIAQFTPGEVCQRLTGSTNWYRGMGTQVYCRATGTAETPAPRSFTINADDIAKACQRTHRNPQATADPTTAGPYGVEFNCRLTNQNGVTLARVSPEEICESKFGTREYMSVLGSNTIVCKGTPTELAQPDGLPNKPPGGGAGGGGGSGGGSAGAPNDIPLTAEAMTRGCRALHGDSATSAPMTYPPAGFEATINCNTASGRAAYALAQFCPHVSGTSGWYITDYGRGTFLPGETPGSAPRNHVCRGSGPLQYHAMADIGRYCKGKGHRYGNYGSTGIGGTGAPTRPACWDVPGNRMTPTYIDMADVCRVVHGGSAYETRGWVYLCLPTGAPPQPVANTPAAQIAEPLKGAGAATAHPCADCTRLNESIARYEQMIKTQEKRIADEEADKRKHEEGLKSLTGREREDWQNIVNASAARIADMKELLATMKAVLEDRNAQLVERQARPELEPPLPSTPTTPVPSTAEVTPPRPTFETVERPRSPPGPTFETVERPRSQPRPTFETVERPRSPSTTTARQPTEPQAPANEPGRASTTAASACPDHEAELTNGERVFHRLYVRGPADNIKQRDAWLKRMAEFKAGLEAPGRQAPGSTSRTLNVPILAAFMIAVWDLQARAKPCEEVTLYLSSHGGVGAEYADDANIEKTGEARPEYVRLFGIGQRLWDTQLGAIVKGFKPGVSVTVIMSACYGGGFAGKGNVEESQLVQLIGVYLKCSPKFDDAITKGIEDEIANKQNDRVTTRGVKGRLLAGNWPLGQPFDYDIDAFLERHIDRPDGPRRN